MTAQGSQQSNIVESLAFLEKENSLVLYSDCVDLFTEALQCQSTMPILEAKKLFDYTCIQCGRWKAEWLCSPVHSPNKRARAQAGKWEEMSKVLQNALTKAMPDPKAVELLESQRALIAYEPITKRAVQYSKNKPFERFLMNNYVRFGFLLTSWGMGKLGYSLITRGLFPRGCVGHPSNASRDYAE